MEDLKFNAVNIDAKALEEQYENTKKSKNNVYDGKKVSFDPKNYLDLKLKENEDSRMVKVRLLPISSTDGTVFFSLITHSLKVNKEVAKSGFKTYVCLNDEKVESDEECPICKKSKQLFEEAAKAREEGNKLREQGENELATQKELLSKSLFKEAGSLKKKITYIVRVIDREHEDEGVKFWRFNENSQGNGIYDKLMELNKTRKTEAQEDGEEDYSIFDLYNGKDIIINVNKSLIPDGFGGMKEKVSYNITDSGNRKPLSKDIEKANAWLNDEKTWKDVYSIKKADYLELVVNGKVPVYNRNLGKYVDKEELNKSQEKEEEEVVNEVLKGEYKTNISNEIVNNGNNDEDEDLPF